MFRAIVSRIILYDDDMALKSGSHFGRYISQDITPIHNKRLPRREAFINQIVIYQGHRYSVRVHLDAHLQA